MIVLDLDGPLLDGASKHYACYRDILTQEGFEPLQISEYWALKRRRVDRHDLLNRSGADAIYERFLAQWLEHIETPPYLALDRLQPGALEVLEEWCESGQQVVLITARRRRDALHSQLRDLGLLDRFAAVVTCGLSSEGLAKAPAFTARFGEVRNRVKCWVGDTEADILAAKDLGITSVALSCGLRDPEYLRTLQPDHLFVGLREMAETGCF